MTNRWPEIKLEELLISLESGSRPKGGVRNIPSGIPSIGGEHLNYERGFNTENVKYVPESFFYNMSRGLIKPNDILIVKDGATTGKTSFVDEYFPYKMAVVNEHVFICRPTKEINSKYLFYFLWSKEGQKRILENFKGSAQGGINTTFASNTNIPLAPLKEQNQIVEKLDKIFCKLDFLGKRLEKIPILIYQFKSLLFNQAVTGELTKIWREKNFDNLKWNAVQLEDIIVEKPRNGYSPRGVDYETKIKSLTLSATTSGIFKPEYVKYLDIKPPPTDSHLWLKNGDILIQRSNTIDYVGVSAIYTGLDYEFIYPDLMMKIRANKNLALTEFLYYSLMSRQTRQYFRENATGTSGNMPKINQQIVLNTIVNLPSIEEQKIIVKKLEENVLLINKIEDRYLRIKNYHNNLIQSIIEMAFRGELAPQSPTIISIESLIKKVRIEKESLTSEVKSLKDTKKSLNELKRKMMSKNLVEILKANNGKMPAKKLWQESDYKDNIDAFYEELKKQVEELKTILESSEKAYLEVA